MLAKRRKQFEGRPLRLVKPGASRKAGEGFARKLVSFFSDLISKGVRQARGLGAPPAQETPRFRAAFDSTPRRGNTRRKNVSAINSRASRKIAEPRCRDTRVLPAACRGANVAFAVE